MPQELFKLSTSFNCVPRVMNVSPFACITNMPLPCCSTLRNGRTSAVSTSFPLHPRFHPGTIQELLRFYGVSDDEMMLLPEVHKITSHKLGNGQLLVSDSAGGYSIIEE